MRLPRFASLALATLASVGFTIRDTAAQALTFGLAFVASVLALFRPEPLAFAGGQYAAFTSRGSPLDSALQQGMRHEAGARSRGAVRHI